jgi:hypothetical protein
MKQAVAEGNTQQAYGIRKDLLKDYPLLADNAQLRQALIEVSQAQQKAVQIVEKPQPPETGEDGPAAGCSPYMSLTLRQLRRAAEWPQARQILRRIHRLAHDEVAKC